MDSSTIGSINQAANASYTQASDSEEKLNRMHASLASSSEFLTESAHPTACTTAAFD